VNVEDRDSAATRGLPAQWRRSDEWYEFRSNPRGRVRVLAALAESRPLAWCHDYDGGRAVYTAMGHTRASFREPRFLAHLRGAIQMAAGQARFDCAP
jgi:type 1 glutamine amidotransferase